MATSALIITKYETPEDLMNAIVHQVRERHSTSMIEMPYETMCLLIHEGYIKPHGIDEHRLLDIPVEITTKDFMRFMD